MSNCKTGDIAVVTWDDEPVFQNVGKLVRVGQLYRFDQKEGPYWFINPVDYSDNYLFIDGCEGDKVKRQGPNDTDIYHPDAWLRTVLSPDNFSEVIYQTIIEQGVAKKRSDLATGKCSLPNASNFKLLELTL